MNSSHVPLHSGTPLPAAVDDLAHFKSQLRSIDLCLVAHHISISILSVKLPTCCTCCNAPYGELRQETIQIQITIPSVKHIVEHSIVIV